MKKWAVYTFMMRFLGHVTAEDRLEAIRKGKEKFRDQIKGRTYVKVFLCQE